jgi:hypothetical protein
MGIGNDKIRSMGEYKECRFIKTNGLKCHSPAMRGSVFCYFHARTRIYVSRSQPKDKALQLPPLENFASLQDALNEIVQALASGRVDTKRAGNLLYALQLARQSLLDGPFSLPPSQPPPSDL